MARETQQQSFPKPAAPTPEETGRSETKPDVQTPFCDEFSGGGGSDTDTRDRGLPGGMRRESDCAPIGRGDGTDPLKPQLAPELAPELAPGP